MAVVTHAISIQQPWASALLLPIERCKPLENRYNKAAFTRPPFPVPAGEWLGIHAGLQHHALAGWCRDLCGVEDGPRGALLGARRVIGWVPASHARRVPRLAPWVVDPPAAPGDAAPDGWCLLLGDTLILPTPIPMRGALGRFALSAPVTL